AARALSAVMAAFSRLDPVQFGRGAAAHFERCDGGVYPERAGDHVAGVDSGEPARTRLLRTRPGAVRALAVLPGGRRLQRGDEGESQQRPISRRPAGAGHHLRRDGPGQRRRRDYLAPVLEYGWNGEAERRDVPPAAVVSGGS